MTPAAHARQRDDRAATAGRRPIAAVPRSRRARAAAGLVACALLGGAPGGTASADLLPPGRFTFRTYGASEGLGNLAIEGMTQDARGLLWVATQDGLYRFDGHEFTRFGVEHGLPSVWTTFVTSDRRGRLWVGTAKGLARQRGDRFAAVPPHALPADRVRGLSPTADGGLLVALESGLFGASADGRFHAVRGWSWGGPDAAFADPSRPGVAYASHGTMVLRADAGGHWTAWETGLATGETIDALALDRSGRLWASSMRRLLSRGPTEAAFRDESHHVDRLTNAVNRSFLGLDRAGRLWVPTDSGLFHLAAGGWRRIGPGQGLPGGWAQGLFHDREGSLWVWQAGVGLHRILGRGLWESWTRAEGLSGDIVWSIHRDRAGTLWVGTSNGLTHAAAGRWAVVAGTEGLAVRSIAEAADGTLWLGCVPAQVVHFDPRGGGVRRFGAAEGVTDAKILDVLVARSGDVWVGTRGGGLLRSRRGEEPFAGVASPRETLFVSEDSRGRIFAGGRGPGAGLAVLEGSRWRRYTTADGLLHDDLLLLREDPHGDLWVAYAEPLGISRLRLEGNVLRVLEHRTPTAGVAGTTYLLGFDGRGRLWRGTGGGIDVLAGTETRHFDSTDGLIGDDCSFQAFWLDAGGDVFIGTSRGLSRFRGGRERGAAAPPTTLVLDARLGTRQVSAAGPEPVVARHHDSLRVRFSGLSFAHARRVEHQVRLLGLETDWVAAGAREVRYPALRPGRYVFEVRSRIGRQAWGPTTRLSFRILPAWWQTWPARAGEATLAGLLLAGLVRLRLRRLQRQRTHLARVVHERTVELRVANDALQRLSTSDVTTGLANRRGFDEWLEQAWRRARREGSEVTVLLLDLDCFKQYNDRYGHPGGDECLRRVGAVLAAAARRSDDLAARYGGEEFALVLPGASRLVAHAIGERIRRQVEDLAIEHAGSTVAPVVTASVGVASTTPRGDVTAAALVAAADEALYRAKAGGRNRVELLPVEPLPVAALPHRPGGKLAVGSGWPGRSAGAGRHAGGFPRPVD